MALGAALLLGGCRTTMDNYIKELLNPTGAAESRAALQAAQIPPHESWCYKTLGKVECYTEPQGTDAQRLVGVDPPSLTPQTRAGHTEAALARARARNNLAH